jgi:hypothetical protein
LSTYSNLPSLCIETGISQMRGKLKWEGERAKSQPLDWTYGQDEIPILKVTWSCFHSHSHTLSLSLSLSLLLCWTCGEYEKFLIHLSLLPFFIFLPSSSLTKQTNTFLSLLHIFFAVIYADWGKYVTHLFATIITVIVYHLYELSVFVFHCASFIIT